MQLYHGSPHKFDHFDLSKIKGNDELLFGWGIYLSSYEHVALQYAEMTVKIEGMDPVCDGALTEIITACGGSLDELKDWYPTMIPNRSKGSVKALIDGMEQGVNIQYESGVLYNVEAPDDLVLLDMGLSLSEQPKKVWDVLAKEKRCFASTGGMFGKYTGDQMGDDLFVEAMRIFCNDSKAVSLYFQGLGIDGIVFENRVGGFRQEGVLNYIIFDDRHLKIVGFDDNLLPFSSGRCAFVDEENILPLGMQDVELSDDNICGAPKAF